LPIIRAVGIFRLVSGISGCNPVAPWGTPLRRRRIAACALALVGALAAAAAPAKAAEMGHVSGTVTSAATGEPLSGVKVCAANVNGDGPWGCDVTGASG
jgi:hypothetical protein